MENSPHSSSFCDSRPGTVRRQGSDIPAHRQGERMGAVSFSDPDGELCGGPSSMSIGVYVSEERKESAQRSQSFGQENQARACLDGPAGQENSTGNHGGVCERRHSADMHLDHPEARVHRAERHRDNAAGQQPADAHSDFSRLHKIHSHSAASVRLETSEAARMEGLAASRVISMEARCSSVAEDMVIDALAREACRKENFSVSQAAQCSRVQGRSKGKASCKEGQRNVAGNSSDTASAREAQMYQNDVASFKLGKESDIFGGDSLSRGAHCKAMESPREREFVNSGTSSTTPVGLGKFAKKEGKNGGIDLAAVMAARRAAQMRAEEQDDGFYF